MATDFETGRLFVADTGNNRVDIFDADGDFERAFGYDVIPGGGTGFEICTTVCKTGLAGDAAGQFDSPTKIAVDNDPASLSHQAVYVVDQNNLRVQRFDDEGNFELTFGGGVNADTGEDICTAESGDTCGEGSSGSAEGEFEGTIHVGVGPSPLGTVYTVDAGSKYRLQRFNPDGTAAAPQQDLSTGGSETNGIAVDSDGDFFVTPRSGETIGTIFKYEAPPGEPAVLLGPIPDVFEAGGVSALALAIEEDDNLLAASSLGIGGASILRLDPAGNPLRRFGYGAFDFFTRGLAAAPGSEDVYASEDQSNFDETLGNRVLRIESGEPGPLVFPAPCAASPLGNQSATLVADVNPEGKATTYHFEYVDEQTFEEEGFANPSETPETSLAEGAADFVLHQAAAPIAVLPETEYRCRVVATNADAPPGGIVGPEGQFETLAPLEIVAAWSFDVGTGQATLKALVDPEGIAGANGFFEYVDDASFQESGFAAAEKSATMEFGGSSEPVEGEATVSGLAPGTTYHFRVKATNSLIEPETKVGPLDAEGVPLDLTFRTYEPPSGALPDNRAYELVSPGQKNSAEVGIPGVAAGLSGLEKSVRIQAAAGSGEAATYTSWTSFGAAGGAPSSSQYYSTRAAAGWQTANISPFGLIGDVLEVPYRGFTPDLTFAAFFTSQPALTPQAQEGTQNLYLRDNETGAIQALTVEPPEIETGDFFCTGYAGASADGTHAIFAARGAMAGAPKGSGFSLYEWVKGEGLRLVSVLPDGSAAAPHPTDTGFGAMGGTCSMGQRIVRHAISEDGSTVFWSYGGTYEGAQRPLFARLNGTETIQLDEVKSGGGDPGKGVFWAASADGSVAFFTDDNRLVSGSRAEPGEPDLYRYDLDADTLTNLTKVGLVVANVKGVVGASESGDAVYFVAGGVLSGEEESPTGQKAQQDANNLYLWREDEGLRFIARLDSIDEGVWSNVPTGENGQRARLSPSGDHLAFLSVTAQELAGFETTIAPPGTGCQPGLENKLGGDPRCAQAFLYAAGEDAASDSLSCVSCNPAGSRPLGPTELPSPTNPYEGPRYLSDDGARVFFESRDALSPADQNQRRDVYEFEAEGAGTCTAASPEFNPAAAGCVSLISSGTSGDESYLLDASSSGRDVFFSTRSRLVGWDENENYDVYDAREGGGFPEPPPPPVPCEEEACKPPPLPTPALAPPATNAFVGPGNPPAKKAKKKKSNKHKRKGKKGKNKKQGKKGKRGKGKKKGARNRRAALGPAGRAAR